MPSPPIMPNIAYTGPDLSSPAMWQAWLNAVDSSLAAHRDTTMPVHFTRSALGKWYDAFRDLKKLLPTNARCVRKLVLRYGPQAAEPLTLTGHLRNEVTRGPVRFLSRGTTRSIMWPGAPKYIYRRPRNSTFDKVAAILATNPTDQQAVTARIAAAMQHYFDSVRATPASPATP